MLCILQLYMRNVSSSNRLDAEAGAEEDTLPPARLDGDMIRFNRCTPARSKPRDAHCSFLAARRRASTAT